MVALAAAVVVLSAQSRSARQLDTALRGQYTRDGAVMFAKVMIDGLRGDVPPCPQSSDAGMPSRRPCQSGSTRASIRIRDGRVQTNGIIGRVFGSGEEAFGVGDVVQVTSVSIGFRSTVDVDIRSTRTTIVKGEAYAYDGSITFEFDQNQLKEAPIEDIFRTIEAVLAPVREMTMRDLIHVGDRLDEVVAIFGQPGRSTTRGRNTVLTYKEVRVAFEAGRVIEVQ